MDGSLQTGEVKAGFGERLQLRVAVHSDRHEPGARWLVVFDGATGEGVEAIAMKRLNGLPQAGGRHAWFEWQPRTFGRHELHAVVLEHRDDPNPGNNVATLAVDVVRCPDGCPVFLPKVVR